MGKEQKSGSWVKRKLYYIGRKIFSVKLKMKGKRQLNIFSTLKQTILCPITIIKLFYPEYTKVWLIPQQPLIYAITANA